MKLLVTKQDTYSNPLAMDNYLTLLLFLPFLWAFIVFLFSHGKQSQASPKLPPGPPPYPIIGNLLDLVGAKPYQALTNLSKTYGKLMTLKLGSTTAIVISSPEMAKEALHKHDLAFSSRTIPDAAKALDHHKVSILWSPATAHWSTLRKISAINLFSPKQLDSTQVHRKRKLQELLKNVQEKCTRGEAIDVGDVVFTTILNSISNTFFSIDLAGYSSDLSHEFRDIVLSMGLLAGKPNVVDYFPALRVFDPQGIRKRMTNYFHKMFRIFNTIIDERMQKEDPYAGSDLLASLLNLTKENSGFTRSVLLHLLQDLFLAGIDTTSGTVEWAMAELIRNPEIMLKSKKELKQALSEDSEPKESDISMLPYLKSIVKETLRLHPLAPILLHKSETNVDIGDLRVPKGVSIMINVWGIARDSNVWKNPDLFWPERFLECEIDFKGSDFELIPFGAGRRICPGLPLASRTVHTMLASLVYHFDWKLANGENPQDLDMSEKYGLTLHRANPLWVIPIKDSSKYR